MTTYVDYETAVQHVMKEFDVCREEAEWLVEQAVEQEPDIVLTEPSRKIIEPANENSPARPVT